MTGTATPYRSDLPVGRDGFAQLLRAEWTKFRTVRGWVVGLVVAALVTVLLGLLASEGSHTSCGSAGGPGNSSGAGKQTTPGPSAACDSAGPVGPDGEAVTDGFYFVHKPLNGDGSVTVRVTSLSGMIPSDGPVRAGQNAAQADQGPSAGMRGGLVPWAKAGLIIKEDTTQGSAYAAIMMTGGHGVRMQWDYTHDTSGSPGAVSAASPRWLRLTRSGTTVTGDESPDGTHWTQVGSVTLAGLPSTVPVGMFVASPDYQVTTQRFGGSSSTGGPSEATAAFDQVGLQGGWAGGGWTGGGVGGSTGGLPTSSKGFQESAGGFTVTGSGDIAPAVAGPGPDTLERSLVGVFAGLIVVIVVGTVFITAEYRRGLISTTLAASPRRGRILAAKAVVLGGVTFMAGLAAAVTAVALIGGIRRASGARIFPVTWLTEVRVVAGTAALLAVAAVLALAVGTLLRRSAAAVAAVVVLVVLPYILAVASVLPTGPAQWLLRVTPAAGFAIQQSSPEYPQVDNAYIPSTGYYPLAPWAGFAVLCAWTALALGLAVVLIRRRDA